MYRPSAAGCGMQVPSRRCERGICKKNSSTLNSPRLIRLPLSLRDLTFQVLFEPCRGSIQLFPIKMSNLQSASLAPHVLHVDGGPLIPAQEGRGKAEVVDLTVLDIAPYLHHVACARLLRLTTLVVADGQGQEGAHHAAAIDDVISSLSGLM